MKKLFLLGLVLISTPAISCELTEEWQAKQESSFAEMDTNGDGKVDYPEYKQAKKDTGAPTFAIKSSWENLAEGKETISKDEYIASKRPRCAGEAVEETETEITE